MLDNTDERRANGNPQVDRQIPPKIGFIGLGLMGTAMASNLAADGHNLCAYVRRPERINDLQALGVTATTRRSDLFDSDITMLPDDAAVRNVFFGPFGISESLRPGAIHLSMSTISTEASAAFLLEHERRGQGYVAAPVFGNPDAARARQLAVIVAGNPASLERCRPVTDSLGQTFVIGTDPAQANLIKLLGNMMTATTLEMLGETVALVRKRGLDPKLFVEILTTTMFGGRAHRIYGEKIVAQSYTAGFALPLVLKDVRLALAEAEAARVPLPSVGVVRDRLLTGIARGYAALDWTALGLIAAEEAGIKTDHP
jgi:3-hydroxyisobutyrate dehydrogenase-like beta-hydroxyacid dehydrogenase